MRRLIVSIIGILSLVSLVFVSGSGPAWAQFEPGNEAAGGGDTQLVGIKQLEPGRFAFVVNNLYAVFLDGMTVPPGIQPHLTEPDVSGKGMSRVVSVVSNPVLTKFLWGWRSTGSQWEKQAVSQMVNQVVDGRTESTTGTVINIKPEYWGRLFGLVPVIVENERSRTVIAWGSHPANTAVSFRCKLDSGKTENDMISLFYVDKEGKAHIVKGHPSESQMVKAFQENYNRYCGIGR